MQPGSAAELVPGASEFAMILALHRRQTSCAVSTAPMTNDVQQVVWELFRR